MPEDPRDIAVRASDDVAALMTAKDRIGQAAGAPVVITWQPTPPRAAIRHRRRP